MFLTMGDERGLGGTKMRRITVLGISLGATLLCAVPVSVQWSPLRTVSISVDKAEAGRPLIGSAKGLHQRVVRRVSKG
jgi:hypothetical protein